ncbi:MAG: transposase [Eisenbergiella sp.]
MYVSITGNKGNQDVYIKQSYRKDNTVYYKEYPLVTGDMDETVIITYSPKYKAYQQKIRTGQIDRAIKIMQSPDKARKGKNPNDPSRFIQKTAVTADGEIAQKQVFQLDEERIREEAIYDGFYAVVTNLNGDVREIININKRRWEIEGNFRIMKTEFEARPVFVRREDSIKAHFITCYISLLVYRLLEKKLGEGFTCSEILKTLREMNVTLLSKDSGYIPSYKRTKLTDALHNAFDFRTDYEFISKADMRTIIKKQNRKNSTNSKIVHIDAKKKTATSLINTEIMAVFDSIKCQRRDFIIQS